MTNWIDIIQLNPSLWTNKLKKLKTKKYQSSNTVLVLNALISQDSYTRWQQYVFNTKTWKNASLQCDTFWSWEKKLCRKSSRSATPSNVILSEIKLCMMWKKCCGYERGSSREFLLGWWFGHSSWNDCCSWEGRGAEDPGGTRRTVAKLSGSLEEGILNIL